MVFLIKCKKLPTFLSDRKKPLMFGVSVKDKWIRLLNEKSKNIYLPDSLFCLPGSSYTTYLHCLISSFPPQNFSAAFTTQTQQDLTVAITLLTSAYVQILRGFKQMSVINPLEHSFTAKKFVLHYTSQLLELFCQDLFYLEYTGARSNWA